VPTELNLEMYSESEVLLPRFTGYISRGLLLHMLQQVDPTVSQRLHEPNIMKPYSVTPLYFRSRKKNGQGYLLDPRSPCRVKIRFLEERYVRDVIEYLSKKNMVMIFDTAFHIASIEIKTKDYSELKEEARPVEAFKLYFNTPTYLASLGAGFYYLFPEPQKIFLNLMRLWNLYTTTQKYAIDEVKEYKAWLIKNMGVTGYEVRTMLVQMREKKAVGFVGWAIYRMKTDDEWNKITCMLARFAEYSGIGGNRTGGFGVTKFMPKKAK